VKDLCCFSAALRQRAVFVTATGTDVGKTVVSRCLVRAWRSEGYRVCAVKPVATGCKRVGGVWIGGDAPLLLEATGNECDPMLQECGIRPGKAMVSFSRPMAPVSAARAEGRRIPFRKLEKQLSRLAGRCLEADVRLVIEGIGGPLVPLGRRSYAADLASRLNVPAVLVAGTGLGTISETLCALEGLRSRSVQVCGIVFSRLQGGRIGAVEASGIEEVRQRSSGVPIIVLNRLRKP